MKDSGNIFTKFQYRSLQSLFTILITTKAFSDIYFPVITKFMSMYVQKPTKMPPKNR